VAVGQNDSFFFGNYARTFPHTSANHGTAKHESDDGLIQANQENFSFLFYYPWKVSLWYDILDL
jgi:hypothetical protein